jgi:hypothetical protein
MIGAAFVCDQARTTAANCGVDHTTFSEGVPLQKLQKIAFSGI